MGMIKTFEQNKIAVTDVEVKPLGMHHVLNLVCDTARCETKKGKHLAELLHEKTIGNPFFVNQMLKSLHQDNLITFNFIGGSWEWDIRQMQKAISCTDNVIELMTNQIKVSCLLPSSFATINSHKQY